MGPELNFEFFMHCRTIVGVENSLARPTTKNSKNKPTFKLKSPMECELEF
jgi:hypothetical protein